MKILYTPLMIVPSVSEADRARIMEAAGPGSRFVEAREAARQQVEIGDTDVLFGRVANDVYVRAKQLRYYHSIGAGVDAILTPELVESDVIVASEKGQVGVHLSEHAFALLLALTRGLHTAIRRNDWSLREPIRKEQRELFEQTMGIVGFGGTGRDVAQRALAFGGPSFVDAPARHRHAPHRGRIAPAGRSRHRHLRGKPAPAAGGQAAPGHHRQAKRRLTSGVS